MEDLWSLMCDFRNKMADSGEMDHKRQRQQKVWMWNQIRENIMVLFKEHPAIANKIGSYEQRVATGTVTPGYAADRLLAEFRNSLNVGEDSGMEEVKVEERTIDQQSERLLDKKKVFK